MKKIINPGILAALEIVLLITSGCNGEPDYQPENLSATTISVNDIDCMETRNRKEAEAIIAAYRDIFEEAVETNTLGSLEVTQNIVERLGENGYVAIDSDNQTDMTEPEQVIQFCGKVDAGEDAELTIIVVSYLGGFTKYDFITEGGNIDIVKGYYQYLDGEMRNISTSVYRADFWQYTEDGYLIFEGCWFYQGYVIYVLNERDEHVALRVQPLDQKLGPLLCACGKHNKTPEAILDKDAEEIVLEQNAAERFEKGYNLPVAVSLREEGENDCKKAMKLIRDIYVQADKGDASNVVLSDTIVLEMQDRLKEMESPVKAGVTYSSMENYESMDIFLKKSMDGISGSVVVYEIHSSGGMARMKFIFDGTDMYLFSMNALWDEENMPVVTYVSYTRIKQWKYTDKGWFCYELCVPEPPEVTEIVDGSHMIRVKPMSVTNREMSEKCVLGLCYQGNNLLCTDWDTDHMEDIDYNGLYEYLYAMKYREKINDENYADGIPRDEFEDLIMEYLPVTAEQIREYAVFDREKQTYGWVRLGCIDYSPTYFETSIPEVTGIRENEDGTITLTVDAVCEMILCDDAIITHELTLQMKEDGSFQYLSNKIMNDGIHNIPKYQYRINRDNALNHTDIVSMILTLVYNEESGRGHS